MRSFSIKQKERSRFCLRALIVFIAFIAVAALLVARLWRVQLRDGKALAAGASQEQLATFAIDPQRGDIVDRFGAVFATTLPSYAIDARPGSVRTPRADALKLSALTGLPPGALQQRLSEHAPFVYVARNLSKSVAARVTSLGLAGISIDQEPTGRRVAAQGSVGSTVIGFTGIDDQGLAGIEYQYDGQLAGHAGSITEETDADGRPIPFGKRTVHPARAGNTVVLTIDRSLQFAADQILRDTVSRYHAAGGSIVVMRALTGEILAMANDPDFDPNHFDSAPAAAWRNQAITDPYEPGSTFKVITATAALDSGKIKLGDTFPALDELRVGGRVIHNADDGLMASGHSYETLDDIVAFSHNVGAAQVALRMGKQTMYEYIRRFGFDDVTGVDLPGESSGLVGTPDNWWGSRLATIGFGQGVSVTPLALTRAYAAVANGGMLMKPLLVRSVISPEGRVVLAQRPRPVRRVMSPQTAASLLNILRDVVSKGTAKGMSLPGYPLAGKTGTAQMVIDGSYVGGAYIASFIGIVPADKPQYVILVKIDRPQGEYYGSIVAAPAFRDLARTVLWREGVLPRHPTAALDALRGWAAGTQAGDAAAQTRNQR